MMKPFSPGTRKWACAIALGAAWAAPGWAATRPAKRQSAVLLVKRASIIYGHGRYEEAAALCREAVRMDAGYVRAYTWLGASQQKSRQKEAACAAWRKVLALAPSSPDAARARRGLAELGCTIVPSLSAKLPRPANGLKPGSRSAQSSSTTLKARPPFVPPRGERIYDVGTNLERILKKHTLGVRAVAFSPDGRLVASGSLDKTVQVWDAASGEAGLQLEGPQSGITSVAFSPDGKTLAAGSYDNYLQLWQLPEGRPTQRWNTNFDINTIAFSPDGSTLVGGGGDGKIWLWNTQTGKSRTLNAHSAGVLSISFSRDGATFVSASLDDTIRLWDTATTTQTKVWSRESPSQVALSPDASLMAVTSGTTVQLRDTGSGQVLHTLSGHRAGVVSLAFSPDGKTLASGSYDSTVRLWDVTRGQLQWKLKGHGGIARAVAFSPDGLTLATASDDNTVNLWRLQAS